LRFESVLSIPFHAEQESIGLLQLTSTHKFTEQALQRLKHIRGQVVAIILRKRVEEKLRISESNYRTLVKNSIQGISIYQGHKMVYANPAECKIFGYTYEELLAMSAEQLIALIHPDDRSIARERAGKRMAG